MYTSSNIVGMGLGSQLQFDTGGIQIDKYEE